MKILRPESRLGLAFFLALMIGTSVQADQVEQLAGVVSSIDLDGKKIAVTPTGKEKPVDVTVNDQTVIQTAGGKSLAFKELKTGDGLGIAHNAGLASKIVVNVKPAELTGHVKSIGANLKTFVVTETGTTTDVTVAVTPDTSIVTTGGKKIELKELKKGDGVGISHVNSVASKVVVNVKPVE
jgi:Cu/Ag efflux protein CusF